MTYRFVYKNNDSRYNFECDADAMVEARKELEMLSKISDVKEIHIWEEKDNGKFRYVTSYKKN